VTHPFHPLLGEEFDLVGYAHTWGEHRVFFREPGQERVQSLPAGWTDVEGPDPFLVLSGGRAWFRVEDLVALVRLLDELDGGCQGDSAALDKAIMPPRHGRG
jgi:hypothetical protein